MEKSQQLLENKVIPAIDRQRQSELTLSKSAFNLRPSMEHCTNDTHSNSDSMMS